MKAILVSSLFLGIAMLFWYCKPSKYTMENLPKTYIKWGSGGGFVGKETNYMLLENGQVFKTDGIKGSMEELKSVKKKIAAGLFGSVSELKLATMDINQPENMYYFLEIGNDANPKRLTWGNKSKEIPQKVKDLYVVLGQLVQ